MQFVLSGRLGMLEMGPWELVNVVDKARFKWDVAPFPKGPAGHTTHQSVDGTFIWNGTKFKDESWTLLKGTTSPFYGRLYIKYATKQPSRKSLAPEFTKILREQNAAYKDVNLEVFVDSIAKDIGRPEEMFNNDKTAKDEILKPAFDKVMLEGKGSVELIGKASKLVEKFNTGQIKIEQIGTELQALGI
jgi:multiple sugar transport system substrate-binding protein